jgi:hypothetical protein
MTTAHMFEFNYAIQFPDHTYFNGDLSGLASWDEATSNNMPNAAERYRQACTTTLPQQVYTYTQQGAFQRIMSLPLIFKGCTVVCYHP